MNSKMVKKKWKMEKFLLPQFLNETETDLRH